MKLNHLTRKQAIMVKDSLEATVRKELMALMTEFENDPWDVYSGSLARACHEMRDTMKMEISTPPPGSSPAPTVPQEKACTAPPSPKSERPVAKAAASQKAPAAQNQYPRQRPQSQWKHESKQ
jgi:hypothetical protein